MTGGPAAVDPGIEADRGLQAFVAEKLAHDFVVAVLDLKNGFRAQVPELMRRQLYPRPLAQIGLDQHRDHRLAFRRAIGVHKNPLRPSSDHLQCDAVTISAIAARVPIPKRLMHILEGESLLNDASGLVCMSFAVAAALTGTFSLGDAFGTFLGSRLAASHLESALPGL